MPSIIVTVESLPYAHRLLGYNGRCSRTHGHNARVEVTIESSDLDAQGFVVDFYVVSAVLTRVLARFHHAFVVVAHDPLVKRYRDAGEHIEPFHAPPTAEHLARYVLDTMNAEAAREAPPGRGWKCTRATWQEEPGFVAEALAP